MKSSRDDLVSTRRVPPQTVGFIPDNDGGFGEVEKAAQEFVWNELTPLQDTMKDINSTCAIISFANYEFDIRVIYSVFQTR